MKGDQASTDRRACRLSDGNEIPLLGLGVWQVPNGRECVNAVRWALELGYRHIDTAQAYGRNCRTVSAAGTITPAVDQVQFSPFEYRRALLQACKRSDVALEAYSPLGTGRHLGQETVTQIADRLGRSPAQVSLRWCTQREIPVIPKSTHRERIEENAQIFDFSLTDGDVAALDALDRTGGTDQALERKWW